MRILFVSDFTLEQRHGGAQVSNSLIIEHGKKLGYDIIEHHHSSSSTDFLSSYDLVINSNLEAISKIAPEKFELIKKLPNSVRLEHDSCSYLSDQNRRELFTNSHKNFFLTDYHYCFFKELYGESFKNVEIVYDPIDTSIFKKADYRKEYDIVYCGYLHPLKGLNHLTSFARENPQRHIHVFGWGDFNVKDFFKKYPNISFDGEKKHSEIAEIFQKCNSVFHFPVVNEPFCRMIGEALLCGVEDVIGDKSKIGSLIEFNKVGYEKFKERCENAPSLFWEKVLK